MSNFDELILLKLSEYIKNEVSETHNELIGDDSYEFYPTSLGFFEKAIIKISENENGEIYRKKFLDLGSGIGIICKVAKILGLIPTGIEKNPKLCEISDKIFGTQDIRNMDIWDFNDYNQYDIVFYYLPFKNVDLMAKFKKRVENNVKIGTYIITTKKENKDNRFIDIMDNKVWLKIKD